MYFNEKLPLLMGKIDIALDLITGQVSYTNRNRVSKPVLFYLFIFLFQKKVVAI
jgi:hypothetical protein